MANSKRLEKVRGKLDGWKAMCLSTAGRITLTKSVINSMGVFQMQVQKMPAGVHKALDKYVGKCVWGEFESAKKVHLVSWEIMCRSMEQGGMGLRCAEGMNMALVAKLCWRLLTQSESLWASTVIKKYGYDLTDPVNFCHKQRASHIWRGIVWGLQLLTKGLDGR